MTLQYIYILSPNAKGLFGLFLFLSLITPHSIFVTHHSSLKIPQFSILTRLAHFTQLLITQFFYFFVGPIPEHNVRPRLAYPRNILGPKEPFHFIFPLKPIYSPKTLNKPSEGSSSSSLFSSSTASSSSAWSPFAPMVSLKLLAQWGKDEMQLSLSLLSIRYYKKMNFNSCGRCFILFYF